MARFMITTIQPKSLSVRKSQVKNGEILVLPHPTLLSSLGFGDPMEISLNAIIGFLLVIIIALSAFMLYREFRHVENRIGNLETKSGEKTSLIEKLDARIKTLEEANRKRMPWEALEKLEHAQAALDLEEFEREIGLTRIKNAKEWLRMTMASGTKREEK